MRNSIGNQLKRTHLLTKKDLYNIEKAFKLRGDQRHTDDATSVKELKDQDGDNPILYYKPQGQKQAIIGHNIGLVVHDFAVVIHYKQKCCEVVAITMWCVLMLHMEQTPMTFN